VLTDILSALPSPTLIAVAVPTLIVAYAIFGIAGFGSALIVAPILAQFIPVATIVPLMALIDCPAAIANGIKLSDKIDKSEMAWLVPLMFIGSLIGVQLLRIIPAQPMMLALGVFVVAYALYALFTPPVGQKLRQRWVLLFGSVGGIFSGMFGSGGFIYATYLSHRLADKDAIRATQSVLLTLSNFTRVVIFTLTGFYSDWTLPVFALALLPAALIGIFIGHRITLNISHTQFLRVLNCVLIGTGTMLILRALA
jgi:uncharacterized membrane protein YfcA